MSDEEKVSLSKEDIRTILATWFREPYKIATPEELESDEYLDGCTEWFFIEAKELIRERQL